MIETQIKRAINGYIVSQDVPYDDNSHLFHHEETVFEQAEIGGCDHKALIGALYQILENIGEIGSKHDAHRVRVLCRCQEQGETYAKGETHAN